MAAPPAKPSPSNQAVQQRTTDSDTNASKDASVAPEEEAPSPPVPQLKAPPPSYSAPNDDEDAAAVAAPAAAAASSSIPPAAAVSVPSYASSETSENYMLARQLLNAGNFEEALSVIQQELETTKATLTSLREDPDLHPAVAPLHYLYGTTLLYSLEEAKDDGQDAAALVPAAAAAAAAQDDDEAADPDPTNPWAHLPEPSSAGATAAASSSPFARPDDDAPPPAPPDDDAEDMEIAWENFEVARHIVERMIAEPPPRFADGDVAKLRLDLAQIMLREGDLQRLNGRYTSAIQDYSSCLEIRMACLERWDRKIADTQFNLGLTYLSSSSELQKETTATAPATTDDDRNPSTPDAALLAKEHCDKGIAAHVECAKTFGGILAKLCGADPEKLLSQVSTAKPAAAGFKTTGLDDDVVSAAVASQTLNTLRRAVTTLVAKQPPTDTATADTVYDIQQMLDEIQETVDEAERAMDAVRQAAEIKAQAQRQAAGLSGPADGTVARTSDDGVTTSIGFGPAAAVAAAASTVPAPPQGMMVVKKKKKRSAEEMEDQDSKRAAADDEVKRAKTAE